MSSYVEGALVKGEQIVHTGHVSLWGLWHLIAVGVLLLPVFGIGLIFLAIAYIRYKSTELAVTTKRIIVKYGFIRRQTIARLGTNLSQRDFQGRSATGASHFKGFGAEEVRNRTWQALTGRRPPGWLRLVPNREPLRSI